MLVPLTTKLGSDIAIVLAGGGAQLAEVVRLLDGAANLEEQTNHLRLADRSDPPPPAEDSQSVSFGLMNVCVPGEILTVML